MNRPHALRLGVNRCLKTVRLSTEKPLVTNPDAFPGHRLARWLAHPADPQRATFQTAVLALVIYVALAVLQQFQVNAGMVEQGAATRQTVFCLAGALTFVLLIQSGLNRHLRNDPALLQAQCGFAVIATAGSYAIQGPNRDAVLSLVTLIMVFGMFVLTAAQAVRLAVFAWAVLGAVMLWKALTDPAHYRPALELFHFSLAGVVLLGIALQSVRLARLRLHLDRQNIALSSALEQIGRLVTRDDLTGLLNRRHMSELLVDEKARHDRSGLPTSVALVDIDLFKRINDQFGHAAGDAVLKGFAQTASASLRTSDRLARWGGEEFLLLLPETDAAAALLCIERIRSHLAAVAFVPEQPDLQVTFSAGLSVLRADETVDAMIERADQAMYAAKRGGRNCTMVG